MCAGNVARAGRRGRVVLGDAATERRRAIHRAVLRHDLLEGRHRTLTPLARRDIAAKAKQLMNIDPNDPHALDCIGSSTKCLVQFRVPYNTVEGEDLFILGSDDKLGRWNQANALPMNWGEGGAPAEIREGVLR